MPYQFEDNAEFEEELKYLLRDAQGDIDDLCGAYYVPLNDDTGYQIEITEVKM